MVEECNFDVMDSVENLKLLFPDLNDKGPAPSSVFNWPIVKYNLFTIQSGS